MSEVPEDEALIRLQLQPEGDLFPCCDGTEEISQSSSNDTPAPERTVCQPCSSGSQLVPPTRGNVVREERLSEEESEQEEESQEEDLEDEEQVENKEQDGADEVDVAVEEKDEEDPTVNPTGVGEEVTKEEPLKEKKGLGSDTISATFMADAAPVEKSKAETAQSKKSVEVEKVVTEFVQESGEEASTDPPTEAVKESVLKEAARKSSVKGTQG